MRSRMPSGSRCMDLFFWSLGNCLQSPMPSQQKARSNSKPGSRKKCVAIFLAMFTMAQMYDLEATCRKSILALCDGLLSPSSRKIPSSLFVGSALRTGQLLCYLSSWQRSNTISQRNSTSSQCGALHATGSFSRLGALPWPTRSLVQCAPQSRDRGLDQLGKFTRTKHAIDCAMIVASRRPSSLPPWRTS